MSKLNSNYNLPTSYEVEDEDSDLEYYDSDSDDEIDVAIKQKLGLPTRDLSEEEDDDFTAEMEGELTTRVNKLQPTTSAVSTAIQAQPKTDILKKSETDKDGENLPEFYDPEMDDEDQRWVDDHRRSYLQPRTIQNKVKPMPNSDAVLNCPACLSLLCLDCQRERTRLIDKAVCVRRHDVYMTQYRAMFVMNCRVDEESSMEYKLSLKGRRRKQTEEVELYNPVFCSVCNTEVAVYDKEEIFHFFNVLASHS
ncbi:EAPP [Cordylochernes scorpioides]|uniref:EAPP n=1 Tax=Cordylochernes scorpioides TaxID=51811 RepID=A0ABY6LH82_9ARAC|nr:EAPP [Cordylochernes scorpioides]